MVLLFLWEPPPDGGGLDEVSVRGWTFIIVELAEMASLRSNALRAIKKR